MYAAQLPSCPEVVVGGIQRLPTSKRVLFVAIAVGAIVAHTQGIPQGSSNTRDEIIVARDDEVLFVHLIAATILFYFSFLKFGVSTLICYFFCSIFVSEIWSSSGLHRN
jgi:hypothetical protein